MNVSAPVDPDVKIPAAVKAAAQRSDDFYKKFIDEGAPVKLENSAASENAEDAAEKAAREQQNPDTNPANLAGPVDDQQPDNSSDANRKIGEDLQDGESLEHKYKSAMGRLRKRDEQIAQLQDQVRNMQSVIASLDAGSTPGEAQPEKVTLGLDSASLVTEQEIADYGEDFLTVVGKRARQEMAPVLTAYQKEIESLRSQLEGFNGYVKQGSQEKLLSSLDTQVPNWRDLNTDAGFLDWLGLPDPYSGGIRHDMLKAAFAQGDALRVAAFFKGFLSEEAVRAPAATGPELEGTRVPKVSLQSLAAPGKAKTAAAGSAPTEKPIISRAEISKFYSDVASGTYKDRDAQKNKREAEIFAAQREGRIR